MKESIKLKCDSLPQEDHMCELNKSKLEYVSGGKDDGSGVNTGNGGGGGGSGGNGGGKPR